MDTLEDQQIVVAVATVQRCDTCGNPLAEKTDLYRLNSSGKKLKIWLCDECAKYNWFNWDVNN